MADPAKGPGGKLTPKQEAFALAFFETGNAAEAYRRAYDVSENARDHWIYVEAGQLLDHPEVTLRLQELREHAERHAIYTRQKAMEELEEARETARVNAQAAAMVSATSAKIKLLGLDKPARLEVTSPDGSMSPKPAVLLANLSDEELAQLERLTDKARHSEGVGEKE
ncbi:terminase small subunit [Pararhodobacter marinus]|uniref:Terminase small subunit n=1 Tax=Pararhodobacter marinus TaxID=2184063 RepID=A0A2U2C4C4_9RHOB|nr:terminase small subunit [Pararhodobacter marinus]PWE26712.1 terminase small subunit [Pararhodobacter marinus]